MASPLAKGLFQKAIGESGGAFFREGLTFDPLAVREEQDVKTVSAKMGVSTLAELRAIPAQKLLEAFAPPQSQGFDFRTERGRIFPAGISLCDFCFGKTE